MLRFLLVSFSIFIGIFAASAQCPVNIDFELGDFTGWNCYSGSFVGGAPVNPNLPFTGPVAGRHVMYSALTNSGMTDPYGHFPVVCPNGSGHSIRLGNTIAGGTADKMVYTFTIPAGQNKFNLIYNYAIVLNDAAATGHPPALQPRLTVDVANVTTNTTDNCSSLTFVYYAPQPLAGFFTSNVLGPQGSSVQCKDWAASSINLDGHAGQTIQITFTATGCGAQAHFGYAYLDVNTECSSAFTGATFCPDDTLVNVLAPFGYQTYVWYNGTHTQVIGNAQLLKLQPPPLSGDSVTVEMTPYNGYGCLSTLKAYLWDTLTVTAYAGPNQKICGTNTVQLGAAPKPGLIYNWSPATGLSDPNKSNPIASPATSTKYSLTVTNSGGGCSTTAIVNVDVDVLSDSLQLIGSASYCASSGQSTALKVLPADSIQWYKDGVPIPGLTGNKQLLNVTQSGAYYATQFSKAGCSKSTAVKQINIYEVPLASFGVDKTAECFPGNSFVFTNKSTLLTSTPEYKWDMGDGTTFITPDVTYSYDKPGTYPVKLTVTSVAGGCSDSTTTNITVQPGVKASFTASQAVECIKDNSFTFSNNSITSGSPMFNWNLGDGSPIQHTTDITYSYAMPGKYVVNLSATVPFGCGNDSSFTVIVNPSPVAGFSINNATQCFPGHQFVLTNSSKLSSGTLQYAWDMGDGVKNNIAAFNYSYTTAGAYTIKLVTSTVDGCADSLSKVVTVYPTPSADFTIRPVCENLQVPIINRTYNNTTSTINYAWDFDNGHTDNVKSPVYSYPTAGTYTVKLTVSTAQCPTSFDTKTADVVIDAPAPGISYPDKDAAFNFPEPLQARNFGTSVTWSPATSLSNRFSYTPSFTGITPQLYTVTIKTATGCVTVDTQLVKTHKKIEIYVPTAFTPDGNGINERLRPVLIGFTKVNYFRIYDRWGKLLFTMNSDQPGWDGKINNRPAEIQTVVWMIEAVDVDGVVHNKQGTTVLYR